MKDVDGLVIQLKHENDILLARVKELEVEVASLSEKLRDAKLPTLEHVQEIYKTGRLTDLLRRIPLDLIRVEEHRQLYIDMCAALNIEPWVEK